MTALELRKKITIGNAILDVITTNFRSGESVTMLFSRTDIEKQGRVQGLVFVSSGGFAGGVG